jgi:hypothetical protein
MKVIDEQEALVEALTRQRRPTVGAEALLTVFRDAAVAIADQRNRLEDQLIYLARKFSDQPSAR